MVNTDRALGRIGLPLIHFGLRQLAKRWPAYSRLLLVGGSSNWVLSWEMRELASVALRLGVRVANGRWVERSRHQAVFYTSRTVLLDDRFYQLPHRLGVAYYHGRPGTGVPQFDAIHEKLRAMHGRVDRIQVSCRLMRDVVLDTGIAPEKVFLIPIGVNLSFFPVQTPESRSMARARLGIPESAVVVGSFQKDGIGWDDGLEPKLIKGPDVLLAALDILRARVKNLFVLLSGPARGYVRAGLERIRLPYRHVYLKHYPDIALLYQAIDLYLVASREEGGPKAVLESMASGVPLVSTRVGQAADLVKHGENGWLADIEDAEGLAHWAAHVLDRPSSLPSVLRNARLTAEANSYDAQIALWRAFMTDFVDF